MVSITINKITEEIMFGSINGSRELEQRIDGQWEYRKNKGFEDVNIAIQKGLKMGHGKTEREIECISMYLETVLKKVNPLKK